MRDAPPLDPHRFSLGDASPGAPKVRYKRVVRLPPVDRGISVSFACSTAMLLLACDLRANAEACYDVCGPGTVCTERQCVPSPAVEELPTDDAPPKAGTSRKRKRKRSRSRDGSAEVDGGEPAVALPPFVPVNDKNVPRYDPNETQTIGAQSGSERIPDHVIRQHLSGLEAKFNKCIATAAEYSPGELKSGRIDFDFGIRPTGRISGVNVTAPSHLRVFGIVPCLRRALFEHRFPTYDGPTTGVTYSFRVE